MAAQDLDLTNLPLGFADAVLDAQRCFRAVLEALSRPGRVIALDALPEPPAGLGAVQSAVLLALADADTPVWLPAGLRSTEAGHALRFYCGCTLVERPEDAAFVVLPSLADLPELDALRQGDPEFPDRSATLLVEVAGLAPGGSLRLRGPGIETEHRLSVQGWTPRCTAFVLQNGERFPLGVDLLLTCGAHMAGLPRTVRLATET